MFEERRGASEVLSFALVFAIITSSVALVYVIGLPGLESERDSERISNAVRAYDILADNMADIYKRGAPSRATEIKLSDAQLSIGAGYRINVTASNASGDSVSVEQPYQPVVYRSNRATLTYANGAVVRDDASGGASMQRDPDQLFGADQTILPIVQTRSLETQSVGSDSTALVRGVRSESEVLLERRDDPPYAVTYNVTTAPSRAPAWERYLDRELQFAGDDPCDTVETDGVATVTCTFETDELYVSVTRIDVELD